MGALGIGAETVQDGAFKADGRSQGSVGMKRVEVARETEEEGLVTLGVEVFDRVGLALRRRV